MIVIVFALVLLLCGCSTSPQVKEYYTYFDTVSCVYSYANDSKKEFEANCKEIEAILDYCNRELDIYHEYSGINNLCTVNLNAGKEVKVSSTLIDFLLYAKELCETTNGETDITYGPVFSIWHEYRNSDNPVYPSDEILSEASKYCGFEYLEINEEESTVRLTSENASLDVGAIGKGYAAEKAAQYLKENNITSYVVNLGGNVRIVGAKKNGDSFRTGIKNPSDPDNSLAVTINLVDTSCVTSGTYERDEHIIDKDTLKPADYFASVSIITEDSTLADALSTAIFCMPYDEGLELINSLENVQCIWIFKDGSIKHTGDLNIAN